MSALLDVYEADTWSKWTDVVKEHQPALLVTLPHNVESTPFNKLRISAAEDLALNRIGPVHVESPNSDAGSLVLMLGCNPASPHVGYQGFVNEIRSNGASLVIATLTNVPANLPTKLACEFLRQIPAADGQLTVGEFM